MTLATALTALGNYTETKNAGIGPSIKSSKVTTKYVNTSLSNLYETTMSTRVKSRTKRSIIQLAGMIRCVSGCDPLSYKSYGCYCGYLGGGEPVDVIDSCCLEHDWCYTMASCPQLLIYFVPYQWQCVMPGYARCGVVPFGGITDKCSYQLCQCDRAFAKCLSRNPCPIDKPLCQSSSIIAIQNIIIG
ncbi:basic phospholipase A2 PA-10A-like [Oppia nitens]|uniref:basic phospholipase A2 PA-10A-like n=1 Tax=Oppia nitens TaxID=1686743 RepID=UPI0023D9FC37|nr:basic phospholipase A2 PA-10A-like [Oppia nitens]